MTSTEGKEKEKKKVIRENEHKLKFVLFRHKQDEC